MGIGDMGTNVKHFGSGFEYKMYFVFLIISIIFQYTQIVRSWSLAYWDNVVMIFEPRIIFYDGDSK